MVLPIVTPTDRSLPQALYYHRLWLALGWFWLVLVAVLSLLPVEHPEIEMSYLDKVEHALAYLSLTVWFCALYPETRLRAAVILGIALYGTLLEYLQLFTVYRVFDYADILASLVGVTGGLLLAGTRVGEFMLFVERRRMA